MPDIDLSMLDMVADKLRKRASELVASCVEEGVRRAESYAGAGGRHRGDTVRRFGPARRAMARARHATGPQKARMIEHVAYRKLNDFWGDW